MENNFSEHVIAELGHYVYRLIDPRNGETFYVGRGQGNRVFDHVAGRLPIEDSSEILSTKMKRITDIMADHLEVIHIIHRHQIPSDAVSEVEAALIDAFSGLTNLNRGDRSNDHGPMHPQQILDKYELPTIDNEHHDKLILININALEGRTKDDIYQQVRFAWRLSIDRARKADYVLAVVRGVVIGAFIPDCWAPAERKYFADIPFEEPKRRAFVGREAPAEIWEKYVGLRGKRLVHADMKHNQNPIRYCNIPQ